VDNVILTALLQNPTSDVTFMEAQLVLKVLFLVAIIDNIQEIWKLLFLKVGWDLVQYSFMLYQIFGSVWINVLNFGF
jgi:hypothetical protein